MSPARSCPTPLSRRSGKKPKSSARSWSSTPTASPRPNGGGYLGAYWGRIDHAWGARSDCHGDLSNPPTSYLRKIYFDTVVFTPEQLQALVKTFGADHVIMGTDYPFDMADYDPIGHVASANFDEATTAAIAGGNARRLLGL